MIIFYQDELYGKEISNSIARYIDSFLNIKITQKRLHFNKKFNLEDLDNIKLIVFTNRDHDFTYWITLADCIISSTKENENYFNILDLTLRKDFPLLSEPPNIISRLDVGGDKWLWRITYKNMKIKTSIKIKEEYIRSCFSYVCHNVYEKNSYDSIEDFINHYSWWNLKEYLQKIWKEMLNETSQNANN